MISFWSKTLLFAYMTILKAFQGYSTMPLIHPLWFITSLHKLNIDPLRSTTERFSMTWPWRKAYVLSKYNKDVDEFSKPFRGSNEKIDYEIDRVVPCFKISAESYEGSCPVRIFKIFHYKDKILCLLQRHRDQETRGTSTREGTQGRSLVSKWVIS